MRAHDDYTLYPQNILFVPCLFSTYLILATLFYFTSLSKKQKTSLVNSLSMIKKYFLKLQVQSYTGNSVLGTLDDAPIWCIIMA